MKKKIIYSIVLFASIIMFVFFVVDHFKSKIFYKKSEPVIMSKHMTKSSKPSTYKFVLNYIKETTSAITGIVSLVLLIKNNKTIKNI